jgi:hypothetical protein
MNLHHPAPLAVVGTVAAGLSGTSRQPGGRCHIGVTFFMWKKNDLASRRLNRESWPSAITFQVFRKTDPAAFSCSRPPLPCLAAVPALWIKSGSMCSRCGRDIAPWQRSAGGRMLSGFLSADGQCYACTEKPQQSNHTTRLYG